MARRTAVSTALKRIDRAELAKERKAIVFDCTCCGKTVSGSNTNTWASYSIMNQALGYIPLCKQCLDDIFDDLCINYKKIAEKDLITQKKMEESEGYIERQAMRRFCMMFDIYYSDKIFDSAYEQVPKLTLLGAYKRIIFLTVHRGKNYSDTLKEEEEAKKEKIIDSIDEYKVMENNNDEDKDEEKNTISKDVIKFFGTGFSEEDYIFLKDEYSEWTSRHECNTKSQEEIIKDICYNRLQNLKALRAGLDTKDITLAFQRLLDAGKLQPKQNASETVSDSQSFGTLIDKWENTRPIPEIDKDLRDVDKIGLYLDVFFKGHLSKVMGLKNGVSQLYNKFMDRYTVKKPEYNVDEDNEVLFDAIFGKSENMED